MSLITTNEFIIWLEHILDYAKFNYKLNQIVGKLEYVCLMADKSYRWQMYNNQVNQALRFIISGGYIATHAERDSSEAKSCWGHICQKYVYIQMVLSSTSLQFFEIYSVTSELYYTIQKHFRHSQKKTMFSMIGIRWEQTFYFISQHLPPSNISMSMSPIRITLMYCKTIQKL